MAAAANAGANLQALFTTEGLFYGSRHKDSLTAKEWWTQRVAIKTTAGAGIADAPHIARAVYTFRGPAHTWWHEHILKGRQEDVDRTQVQQTWAVFKRAFFARYIPEEDRSTRILDLTQPKQAADESITDYGIRVHAAVGNQIDSEFADLLTAYQATLDDAAIVALLPPAGAAPAAGVNALRTWLNDAINHDPGAAVQTAGIMSLAFMGFSGMARL